MLAGGLRAEVGTQGGGRREGSPGGLRWAVILALGLHRTWGGMAVSLVPGGRESEA